MASMDNGSPEDPSKNAHALKESLGSALSKIFQDTETLTYEDLVIEFEAIRDETARLEIKQEVSDRNYIANTACALANTFGGAIVIGFLDPESVEGQIIPVKNPIDCSVRATNALISSIQEKSYPAIRCDGYRLRSKDGVNGAIRRGRRSHVAFAMFAETSWHP